MRNSQGRSLVSVIGGVLGERLGRRGALCCIATPIIEQIKLRKGIMNYKIVAPPCVREMKPPVACQWPALPFRGAIRGMGGPPRRRPPLVGEGWGGGRRAAAHPATPQGAGAIRYQSPPSSNPATMASISAAFAGKVAGWLSGP